MELDILDEATREDLLDHGIIVVDVGRPVHYDSLQPTLSSTVTQSANATIVEVFTAFGMGTHLYSVNARGDAIRHPDDRHIPEIGYALAYARALRSAASRIERVAQGQIDHVAHLAGMTHKTLEEWEAQKAPHVPVKASEKDFLKAQKKARKEARKAAEKRTERLRLHAQSSEV